MIGADREEADLGIVHGEVLMQRRDNTFVT